MSGMSHSKTVHRQIYLVCPYMGEPLSRGRGTLLYMAITLKPANGNAHLRIILSLCYLIICIIRTHNRRGFAPEILRSWFGPSSASKWSTVSTDVCGTGTFDQSWLVVKNYEKRGTFLNCYFVKWVTHGRRSRWWVMTLSVIIISFMIGI